MNRYEKFDQLIREITLVSDEIKKNWNSESADIFCTSFDDSAEYIRKVTESFRDTLEKSESGSGGSTLSDFSF